MTGSLSSWSRQRIVETVLTAAVFLWIGALVVDVIQTASTPVQGRLIASIMTGVTVAMIMYFSQSRKRKGPANPQVKMPRWLPPGQAWYMAGILLLLIYLQIVVSANAAGTSWASTWLSFATPLTDAVARVVPALDAYSESLTANGYGHRVAIVRHAQGISWPWLFFVNLYLLIWFVLRAKQNEDYPKTVSNMKLIFFFVFAFIFAALANWWISIVNITYGNHVHGIYDLIHYIDSSLMLNSIIVPSLFLMLFTLVWGVIVLVLAKISNVFR